MDNSWNSRDIPRNVLPDVIIMTETEKQIEPVLEEKDPVKRKLQEIVGTKGLLTAGVDLAAYSFDGTTNWQGLPEVVVFPTTAEQVSEVLKLATEQEIPVTPRGAGSNLSGGSVPVSGGIVLCTTRMNKIIDLDAANFTVTAEVGVLLNDLNQELAKRNLFFPPDPQSFLAATIGGCVSENAGGPRCFKYGVTSDYVMAVEGFLMNGEKVKFGSYSIKDVSGYDIKKLIVGSEGTLIVLSKIILYLKPFKFL